MPSRNSTSASDRGCAICGDRNTEECHVKAKREFNEEEVTAGADKTRNIVHLCRKHHQLMDNGWVAIAPSCDRVIYREGAERIEEELEYTVNIAEEYIRWRNKYSDFVRPFSGSS